MRLLAVIFFCLTSIFHVQTASANFDGGIVSSIEFARLDRVTEQRIFNLIQSAVGLPFDPDVVEEDLRVLNSLGEFERIRAESTLQENGNVHLLFTFTEQQIIAQISVVGNTLLSDQELLERVPILPGLGKDNDAIERGRRAIVDIYKEQGNYLVEVFAETILYSKGGVDERTGLQIDESVALIYRVIEGLRVRVKAVSVIGNHSFADKELTAELDTNTSVPFFRRGELNEAVLETDAQRIRRFYMNRGYSDVRVSFNIMLSQNDKEAKVKFFIEENAQYILGGISLQFNKRGNTEPVFADEQIAALIPMKAGDVYRPNDLAEAVKIINRAYGVLGRIVEVDPRAQIMNRARKSFSGGNNSIQQEIVRVVPYHAGPEMQIDVIFVIEEGIPTKVGLVTVTGNTVTKDSEIRGRLGLIPGYPFDAYESVRSKERMVRSQLFSNVTMTIQDKDSDNPGYTNLEVAVEERQTGTLSFGLMAGSDSGLMGNISMTQSNFDIADFPETWSEFWGRKAFIGAGQQFSMEFQPGDERFNYGIGLTDPRFLDTDYSVGGRVGYSMRTLSDYTKETLYSRVSVGRRFGELWNGNISLSMDKIELTDIDDDIPIEIYNDRGPSTLNSVSISATRSTLEPWSRPSRGSRLSLSIDQFGVPSGDYSFTKTSLDYTTYLATSRDFLDRATTLRIDTKIGYIFNGDSPTFSRFTLGGRSMRGFEFMTISPKGTPRVSGGPTDVSIGGIWELFIGAQYEIPLLDRFISMVVFCDSGTVTDSPGFDEYRVSVGSGIRLHIPQLGNAPLAFDFGFPVVKQETDEKSVFSFSVQLPF
jgi:outer membrane protein insertion porin family